MNANVLDDLLGGATPKPSTIALTVLHTDGGAQMRARLDDATISEYRDAMTRYGGWGSFPAVTIIYDGDRHWLADGFHRVEAFRQFLHQQNAPDAAMLPADIAPGTRRDAVLHAAGANANHGLRRSQADKRRSVETLLRDDEWRQWSDREIARRCNVSADLVGAVRKELYPPSVTVGNDSEPAAWVPPGISRQRTFFTKHGSPATMQTANINAQRQPAPSPEQRQYEAAVAAPAYTPLVIWQAQHGVCACGGRFAVSMHREDKGATGDLRAARLDVRCDKCGAEQDWRWNAGSQPGNGWNMLVSRPAQSAPVVTLDALPVVDSITVRVGAGGKPNMDWEPEEWEAYQREIAKPIAAYSAKDWQLTKQQIIEGAPATRPAPAARPGELPADLAERGWELRQVPGSGRWYANNKSGPRATAIFDKPEDAIAAAYDLQRDLRSGPVAVEVVEAPEEDDLRTIDKLLNCATAHGVLQGMAEYWDACLQFQIGWRRDPANPHGLALTLALHLPDGQWKTFEAPTLAEAIRKADLAL